VADFVGQHAIITGGSSGIGRATAVRLAREGAHVTIVARGRTRLDEAREAIAAARVTPDQRVAAFVADVTERQQVASAIAAAIDEIGPPDILMTSAGVAHCDYFRAVQPEAFERAMATNYFGTLYAIHAALPAMDRRRRGHLVLISSGAGLIGIYGYAAYSPTKFAVRGLGESLRAELRPSGIHVSIVYPPDTDTPQLDQERRTKPPETRMISSRARTWSADSVAQTIVLGIRRGTFTITPGLAMTLLARLHSVVAPGLNWYFDRLAARARR
jgi:3-dehydrosphinganine reductase